MPSDLHYRKDSLRVGDVIVYDHMAECPYLGVISKINIDKYGYQHQVFVRWQNSQPRNYNADVGYSGFNICAFRNFKVIRH